MLFTVQVDLIVSALEAVFPCKKWRKEEQTETEGNILNLLDINLLSTNVLHLVYTYLL